MVRSSRKVRKSSLDVEAPLKKGDKGPHTGSVPTVKPVLQIGLINPGITTHMSNPFEQTSVQGRLSQRKTSMKWAPLINKEVTVFAIKCRGCQFNVWAETSSQNVVWRHANEKECVFSDTTVVRPEARGRNDLVQLFENGSATFFVTGTLVVAASLSLRYSTSH